MRRSVGKLKTQISPVEGDPFSPLIAVYLRSWGLIGGVTLSAATPGVPHLCACLRVCVHAHACVCVGGGLKEHTRKQNVESHKARVEEGAHTHGGPVPQGLNGPTHQ